MGFFFCTLFWTSYHTCRFLHELTKIFNTLFIYISIRESLLDLLLKIVFQHVQLPKSPSSAQNLTMGITCQWIKSRDITLRLKPNIITYSTLSIVYSFHFSPIHILRRGQKELLRSQIHILLTQFSSFTDANPSPWTVAIHIAFNVNSYCGCFKPMLLRHLHGNNTGKENYYLLHQSGSKGRGWK